MSSDTPDLSPVTPSSQAPTVVNVGNSLFVQRAKLVIEVVILAGIVWGINFIRDVIKQNKSMAQAIDTMSAQQVRLGTALTTANTMTANQEELIKKIREEVGKEVTEQIKKDGGKVTALYQATGTVQESVGSIAGQVDALTASVNGLRVPYMGFVNHRLVQDRGTLPALAEADVTYTYDPAFPEKGGKLTGKWLGYQEQFYPSLTTWDTSNKGYRAAFQLYRNVTVRKADGTTEVKREDINLTSSEATFSPEAFGLGPVVPRWTATLGVAKELDGRQRTLPAAMIDYRFTTKLGVSGGVVGTSAFVGGSYRFGK
jgi:hypothetical protein